MEQKTISFIIVEILKILVSIGLADGTIKQYQSVFSKIDNFFKQNSCEQYSEKVIKDYWLSLTQKTTPYSLKYLSSLSRSIDLINEYVTNGSVIWSHKKRGCIYTPCTYYQNIIDDSLNKFRFEGSTLSWYKTIARKFCCKLEEYQIFEFSKISSSLITQIITDFGSENSRSMGLALNSIKKFISYLSEKDLCDMQIMPTFLVKYKRVKHIPEFSIDETKSILYACDRNTPQGKRNYSIILLAVTCGLRRSDLQALQLNNIDWHRYELSIVQCKTQKVITLPLTGGTGNAIADYILSARPKDSAYNNIFLTVKAPFRPLITSAYNDMFIKLCKKASVSRIEGRNFHSLRRSTGTWMANSGVPITTISQVLGHSNFHSTDRYISAAPDMVLCSLDFTGISLTSEVYR